MSAVNRKVSHPLKSGLLKTKSKTNELSGKEEEYKRLNAELEAKSAILVHEAEEVIKGHDAIFSDPHCDIETAVDPLKSRILDNIDADELLESVEIENPRDVERFKDFRSSQSWPNSRHGRPPRSKSSQGRAASAKHEIKNLASCVADNVAIPDQNYMNDLQDTFQQMSEQITKNDLIPGLNSAEFDDVLPSTANDVGAEATIRFLKAKLHVMQEELDKLSQESHQKEDEAKKAQKEVKQMEEERTRLQKTITNQQSQIDKYKKMFEDGKVKIDGLESQVTALKREIEDLKRNNKKDGSTHKATEVRLNRALEEIEKYKEQLQKMKNESKEHGAQDKKRTEQLMAENRRLEKQKNELMTGFRKQLKLIDILKKQKLHTEASKMLSFTEEEFVKAMEWET